MWHFPLLKLFQTVPWGTLGFPTTILGVSERLIIGRQAYLNEKLPTTIHFILWCAVLRGYCIHRVATAASSVLENTWRFEDWRLGRAGLKEWRDPSRVHCHKGHSPKQSFFSRETDLGSLEINWIGGRSSISPWRMATLWIHFPFIWADIGPPQPYSKLES